jgi:hypothetical protein
VQASAFSLYFLHTNKNQPSTRETQINNGEENRVAKQKGIET